MSPSSLRSDTAFVRRLSDELSRRLRAGEVVQVESILDPFPSLRSDPRPVLELIRTEWQVRRELGQAPEPSEYYARFPQWRGEIERLLAADTSAADLPTVAKTTLDAGPPAAHEPPGPRVDRYEVAGEIGHGAMGVVYRAWDPGLERWVALKLVRAGALAGAEELARFRRESKAPAAVDHPHIVRVYDVGTHAGLPFYTMALAAGGNLAQHHRRYTDPRAAAALVEKVARAVGAAHAQGIVHRDLKPANILFDDRGEPLVADFGLAKLAVAGEELTETGRVLGTPAYMAPELAAGGAGDATPAADVWSLGVILYELLTGHRPHGSRRRSFRTAPSPVYPPVPPRPGVDARLDAVVLRCLEANPAWRYADARGLADDLAGWRGGTAVRARLPGVWRRTRAWLGRHPLVATALVASAVVAGLLSAAPGVMHPDPEPPLRALERRHAGGEPLGLVDRTGVPAYSHWAGPEGVSFDMPEAEGAFTLSHPSLTFLELYPGPTRVPFRLRASVRFLANSTRRGRAGIYCGYRPPGGDYRGVRHLLWEVSLCDRAAAAPDAGDAAFQFRICGDLRGVERPNWTFGSPAAPLAPSDPPGFRWHEVVLEATAGRVRGYADGVPIGEMSPAEFAGQLRPLFADEPPPPPGWLPEFRADGGLGLMLYNASVAFRDVVVEPIKK